MTTQGEFCFKALINSLILMMDQITTCDVRGIACTCRKSSLDSGFSLSSMESFNIFQLFALVLLYCSGWHSLILYCPVLCLTLCGEDKTVFQGTNWLNRSVHLLSYDMLWVCCRIKPSCMCVMMSNLLKYSAMGKKLAFHLFFFPSYLSGWVPSFLLASLSLHSSLSVPGRLSLRLERCRSPRPAASVSTSLSSAALSTTSPTSETPSCGSTTCKVPWRPGVGSGCLHQIEAN